MTVYEKIRLMREFKQWSREEMAEKLNMSTSGYAKIERGETKLHWDKLERIAQVFNMEIFEFLQSLNQGSFYLITGNKDNNINSNNRYDNQAEIEKLQLIIEHKEAIILQKENEISLLKEMIALIKESKKEN